MDAPSNILNVWDKFKLFPMETLTKAWDLKYFPNKKQRTIHEMVEHRKKTGASGNCFDLTIWLLYELKKCGIHSYAVGEHLGTKIAHIAVIAMDEKEKRYLCDSWIKPILIEPSAIEFSANPQKGYFTGATVQLENNEKELKIKFLRKNLNLALKNLT